MRLITWNCFQGTVPENIALLAGYEPDVVVLQEVTAPGELEAPDCHWCGEKSKKGIAVIAMNGYALAPYPLILDAPPSFCPVHVVGSVSFNLLAIWAYKAPTYIDALLTGLEAYEDIFREDAIVVGDFNSHPRFDAWTPPLRHQMVVDRLATHHLISSYHHHWGVVPGAETHSTLFWQWQEDQPFHIDYCYVPAAWADYIEDVTVGDYAGWYQRSDHRPVIVDLVL